MLIKGVPLATKSRSLRVRPDLDFSSITAQGKPTFVTIGAISGYSLPIYNNDDQEVFGKMFVPGRWNGSSDITVYLRTCLAAAEDVGDKFKFQLSWNTQPSTGILPSSTVNVEVQQAVSTGRAAQYDIYDLEYTLVYNHESLLAPVVPRSIVAFRIRRVASDSPAISGQVILLEGWAKYVIDKAYTE